MKFVHSLIAIAVGVALATPAFAQHGHGNAATRVGGSMRMQAQVPNPVPAANHAFEHAGKAVQAATGHAMQAAQDETGTPPPSPVQAQGSAHAAANSSVVQRDLWNTLDTDHDGTISTTEAGADASFDGHFAAMDGNGDGKVGADEYRAYAKANMGTGGQNANAGSQAATTMTWNNIDADKDGKLSATEVESYENLKANFAGMDSDGDGFVTQDEYRAYQKANREPGKP
jgi:Ca2+-binding EF-hand superfamily protein